MREQDGRLTHALHVKYLMVVVCVLHLIACNQATPYKRRNEKILKNMQKKTTRDADEWIRQNARKKAAWIMAAGIPYLAKKLEKDGIDKFMDYLDEIGKVQAERDTKVREAEKKLSPEDEWEYNELWNNKGLVLPHEQEDFLRSKGLL